MTTMGTDGRLQQLQRESPLLTALETAVWLRLIEPEATPAERESGIRCVHRLVQQKRLRPVRPGKSYNFAVAELHRLVADETKAGPANGGAK